MKYYYVLLILSLNTYAQSDLTAIKSVLISSNQCWKTAKHKSGSATLFADFAGLAMFVWGGPVACVASFAMSYLTYQNDN